MFLPYYTLLLFFTLLKFVSKTFLSFVSIYLMLKTNSIFIPSFQHQQTHLISTQPYQDYLYLTTTSDRTHPLAPPRCLLYLNRFSSIPGGL